MTTAPGAAPRLRVAVLGSPSRPEADWSPAGLHGLRTQGFNAVQLNIAWGYRPADEVLNLEDILEWRGRRIETGGEAGEAAFERRRSAVARRARLAKAADLRTILHVGAPYTGRSGYGGRDLPQCVSDPRTLDRYVELVATLAQEFPDVDDLLLYTYDQDAWLCSEFAGCDRCHGVPLHSRVTPFVNAVAHAWRAGRQCGRLWWEPWELSAGQALACVDRLDPESTGLALHTTVAEVAPTLAPDRWFRSMAEAAALRGVPVLGEVFLSSANEETEPLQRYPAPLVTLRQLRAVESCPGVTGIKEYYGLHLTPSDANLAVACAYFRDPGASEDVLLGRVTERYGPAADEVAAFWRTASRAYELYPWDVSWFARQLGRSMPAHAMSAAIVRGMQSGADSWDTPSWHSTRGAIFLRTENRPTHPWLLEDVQLRCSLAADLADAAVADGVAAVRRVPAWAAELCPQVDDVLRFAVRVRAYALHLRETNVAALLRRHVAAEREPPHRLLAEMESLLLADLLNQRRLPATSPARPDEQDGTPEDGSARWLSSQRWTVPVGPWRDEVTPALDMLRRDPVAFLSRYFTEEEDVASRGQFSLTSR